MTAFVPTASNVGTATVFTSLAASDSVTFLQPYNFFSTENVAVSLIHASTAVVNMTSLMSGGSHAIEIGAVSSVKVTNTATGVIGSASGGTNHHGISITGTVASVFNDGHIFSTNGRGISSTGSTTAIQNNGTIHGNNYGVHLDSSGYILTNNGTITGGNASGAVGVYMGGTTGNRSLVNSGVIETLFNATSAYAIFVSATGPTFIYNSGTIRSAAGTAINAFASTGALYVENSGRIEGGPNDLAIAGTNTTDIIINTGFINKSIGLADGADIYDGRGGQVAGTVAGGLGNDTYRLSDTTTVILEISGQGTFDRIESTVDYSLLDVGEVEILALLGTAVQGVGNELTNQIEGNDMANVLLGLAGNDTFFAGVGNDTAYGGTENDVIYGGEGDDSLHGNKGSDTLEGNDGDDVLSGGSGTDTLLGGDGEDRLTGGRGRDVLTGGEDADTFVFVSTADSGTTGTSRDTITDFEAGLDVLDLSAIDARTGVAGNQTFTWIGSDAFSGATGQLRFLVSGTAIIVEGTVNADTVADFQVRLNSLSSIAVDDILL